MAIQPHQHYEPFYETHEEQPSSASAFIAALALLLLLFLIVVLLWAPWSGAGDTSGGTNPTLSQPVPVQPGVPVQPDGIQIAPSAPQNPGSSAGR